MDAPLRAWDKMQQNTTLVGLTKLKQEKEIWRRVVWLMVVGVSTAFVVFQTGLLLGRFLRFETRSNRVDTPLPVEFPAVTFCSQNPYKRSVVMGIPSLKELLNAYKATTNTEKLSPKEKEAVGEAAALDSSLPPRVVQSTYCICQPDGSCLLPASKNETLLSACVCVYAMGWTCFPCPQNQTCHYRYYSVTMESAVGSGFDVSEGKIANQQKLEQTIPFIVKQLDKEVFDHMAYSYEDLFVSCSFGEQSCGKDHFTRVVDAKYGACYTFNFNSPSSFNVSRSGARAGLRVLLFTELDDYLDITERGGARVVIHNQENFPFADSFGYDASNGFDSSFSLSASYLTRISYGGEVCETVDKAPEHGYEGKYTVEACKRSCSQRLSFRLCGCVDPHMAAPPDLVAPFCVHESKSQRKCLENVTETYTKEADASCVCRSPCQERSFSAVISQSRLEQSFAFHIAGNKTIQDYVMVSVLYDSLSVDALVEGPSYTFSNLVSDLGATVGFWIGMSLVGLYELVIFLVDFGLSLIRYAAARRLNARMPHLGEETGRVMREREIADPTIVPVRRDWDYRTGRYNSEVALGVVHKRNRHFATLARILGINPSKVHTIHQSKLFQ